MHYEVQDIISLLPHGSSKLYVQNVIYDTSGQNAASLYVVQPKDVKDHFGYFRGVDMLECFAQYMILQASLRLMVEENQMSVEELRTQYFPIFLGVEGFKIFNSAEAGDMICCLGSIDKFRFGQINSSGIILKLLDNDKALNVLNTFTQNPDNFPFHSEHYTTLAKVQMATGRLIKKTNP